MNEYAAQKKNKKQVLFCKTPEENLRGKTHNSQPTVIAESTLEGLHGRVASNDACDTSAAEFKPHITEIAFPQPKVFQKKVIAQTTKCPSMTEITILTQTLSGL